MESTYCNNVNNYSMLCGFASVVLKLDVDVSALSDTSKRCRLSGANNGLWMWC